MQIMSSSSNVTSHTQPWLLPELLNQEITWIESVWQNELGLKISKSNTSKENNCLIIDHVLLVFAFWKASEIQESWGLLAALTGNDDTSQNPVYLDSDFTNMIFNRGILMGFLRPYLS